jgi:Type II secretion system (T2SS), protein M subtype b
VIQLGLSPRDRRTLTRGAVVVIPLLTMGRGMPALIDWQRGRARDAADVARVAAQARLSSRLLPTLRDTLNARRARLASLDSLLLTAPSAAAAAAVLASTLGELADSAAMRVASMQLRADSAVAGALTVVGVRLAGIGDVAGLAGFLRAVEGGDAPFVVRELSVMQPDPGAADAKPEVLRIDVLIEALVRVTRENHQ